MQSNKLIDTEEYQSFRSSVPLKKIAVDSDLTKVNKPHLLVAYLFKYGVGTSLQVVLLQLHDLQNLLILH